MSAAAQRVRAALLAAGCRKEAPKTWTCPAHEDRKASLSASVDDGRVLLHCHAGCSFEAVIGALGLTPADLFDDPPAAGNG